ncbi:NHL repeat-containing protein [Marinigracilibium pacificum]|uniref:NHL repeat-containing protein n=1 Tax=Marinigracilibium pacificum TaxID=2729599 RepID=A0A848IYF0_9BACT|nr:hypothetical protein [Marinigracilibium pacificum]NMM47320.1 hypothetical protein [Marinigracilibium pacificum]
MKTIPYLCIILVLLFSCEDDNDNNEIKDRPAKVYNTLDEEIDEAASGTKIKLKSQYFAELNANEDLVKDGLILINDKEIHIEEADQDYVLFELTVFDLIDPEELSILFRFRNEIWRLCDPCLWYLPTVRGVVYAGEGDEFDLPGKLTIDTDGNLYVIDQQTEHDLIKKVDLSGSVSIFAGGSGEFGRLVGIDINESENLLYIADATAQQVKSIDITSPTTINIIAGDGTAGIIDGPAASASFNFGTEPLTQLTSSGINGQGLTLDDEGNIYVGNKIPETFDEFNVRKISVSGEVTTVPGSHVIPTIDSDEIRIPAGLTYHDGSIYYTGGLSSLFQGIVELNSGSSIDLAGDVTFEDMLDGTGSAAAFSYPADMDYHDGYLYVVDGSNGALRRVTLSGETITLAGVGHFDTPTWCGCERTPPATGFYYLRIGSPASIKMDQVSGVVAKTNQEIYVSDFGYKLIWKITIR